MSDLAREEPFENFKKISSRFFSYLCLYIYKSPSLFFFIRVIILFSKLKLLGSFTIKVKSICGNFFCSVDQVWQSLYLVIAQPLCNIFTFEHKVKARQKISFTTDKFFFLYAGLFRDGNCEIVLIV